uniref:BTB domain-containing protein n=1 Tax=Panagrolaimus sp. JU765 TaxID=591449 RepID=A0AC34Q314_9BILA
MGCQIEVLIDCVYPILANVAIIIGDHTKIIKQEFYKGTNRYQKLFATTNVWKNFFNSGQNICATCVADLEIKRPKLNLKPDAFIGSALLKNGDPGDVKIIVDGKEFRSLLKNGDPGDVKIIVDGKEFRCHKFILVLTSPVLKAMFESNFMEAKEKVWILKDFNADIVEIALEMIHEVDVSKKLNFDVVCELYRFSDKYELKNCMEYLSTWLTENLDIYNVCYSAKLSVQYNIQQLYNKAVVLLAKNVKIIATIKGFECLTVEIYQDIMKNLVNL